MSIDTLSRSQQALIVAMKPGVSQLQKALGGAVGVHRSAVSRTVGELVQLGLVVQVGRKGAVLTEEGAQVRHYLLRVVLILRTCQRKPEEAC
jgi:Mn-dependent DtxR family transcriptional regulator